MERRSHESSDVVILIHGLNSRPEDFATLHASLRAAGHDWYDFRYPNDQPIADSARQLASDLRWLAQQRPNTRVHVIAHSMGGLVARRVIEDPALDPGNVRRLILVAVPNHGSDLAITRCPGLDVWEFLSSDARRDEAGWLSGSIQDGWCDALLDLQPGSEFLRDLNQRPRNLCVNYSLLVGNGGPELLTSDGSTATVPQRSGWWSRCLRRTQSCLQATLQFASPWDELRSGVGDGAITVRRTQLHDVADVVVDGSSHATLVRDPRVDRRAARIHREILQRLPHPTREIVYSR